MKLSADWRMLFGFAIIILLSCARPGLSHQQNDFYENPNDQKHTHDEQDPWSVGSEDPNLAVVDRSAPAAPVDKPADNIVPDLKTAKSNVSDIELRKKLQNAAKSYGLTEAEFNRVARSIGLDESVSVGGGINGGVGIQTPTGQLFAAKRFCGFSPRVDQSRLSNCAPGQFPWSVAILTSDKKFLCSGTLVSESIVVTTASCVLRYRSGSNQPLLVVLGAWSLPEGYEYMPELELFVSAAVINPSYNQNQNINTPGNIQNNVALLRLVENVDFDVYPHIFPICLIDTSLEQQAGINQCLVLGWPGLPEVQTWRTRAYLASGSVQVIRQGCANHQDSGACAQGQCCIGNEGSTIQCLTSSNRYYQWGMIVNEPNCDRAASVSVAIVNLVDHYDFISQYLWTPNPNHQPSKDVLGPVVNINNNNLNNQPNIIRVPAGGAAVVHGVNNPNIIRA